MEYLIILIAVFVITIALELTQKIHLYQSRQERLEIIAFFFVVGVIWDSFAIVRGHWVFPPEKTLGVTVGAMPLEEYAFMFVIPHFIITFYKFFDSKFRKKTTK